MADMAAEDDPAGFESFKLLLVTSILSLSGRLFPPALVRQLIGLTVYSLICSNAFLMFHLKENRLFLLDTQSWGVDWSIMLYVKCIQWIKSFHRGIKNSNLILSQKKNFWYFYSWLLQLGTEWVSTQSFGTLSKQNHQIDLDSIKCASNGWVVKVFSCY